MSSSDLIRMLKECGAIQFGKFILTSGATSDYYINIKKASTDPRVLKEIAIAMKPYTEGVDLLAGMELGAVPLVVALSLQTNIPYVIIRKEKREHGTGKQIEGGDVSGKNILLVEDVATSGGSIVRSLEILSANQGNVRKVITVVDRQSGAREKIEQFDVAFVSLVTVSDILPKNVN
jgi:orotate phosphoribosyltransferase